MTNQTQESNKDPFFTQSSLNQRLVSALSLFILSQNLY